MKVNIDNLNVAMELGNNGIQFSVYDNDEKYRGKLRIGRATVEWCKGRTQVGRGIKMNWNDLISAFEDN